MVKMPVKEESIEALKKSYQSAFRDEEIQWQKLTAARQAMLDAAMGNVPQVTVRKWLTHLEGRHRIDILHPDTRKILDNLSHWCGADRLAHWMRASRMFNTASDLAFRSAMELKAAAGIEVVSGLDGERPDGALRRKLIAIATRLNPTVELNLVRELYAEGPALLNSGAASPDRMEVAGMHVPYYNMSTISLSSRFDPLDTVYHEMWHSIEPVLTPEERKLLRQAFPGDRLMTHEERTAVAFAAWATGNDRLDADRGKSPGTLRTFRKVAAAGGQFLRFAGSHRIEQIFGRAYSGEMGQRMVRGFREMTGRQAFLPISRPVAAKISGQIPPVVQKSDRKGMRR